LLHVKQLAKTKAFQEGIGEIDQLLMKKLTDIEKSAYIATCISRGEEVKKQDAMDDARTAKKIKILRDAEKLAEENPKGSSTKTGRVRKPRGERKPKAPKGETYQITYSLLKEGMDVAEIAATRGLAQSTIETHLAKGIADGAIDIHTVIDPKVYNALYPALKAEGATSGNVYEAFKGEYTYGQIRMVQAQITLETPAEEEE
jgi:hypothetical protein